MPFQKFILSIKIGHLYTFISPKVSVTIPHHFLLLGHTDNYSDFIFNCCTSKFNKRVAHADKNGISYATIVPISPDSTNKLTMSETCIDCNTPIHHTKNELEIIFNSNPPPIAILGTITESHINQVLIGTHLSDMVDEWMKDFIPKNIDSIPDNIKI